MQPVRWIALAGLISTFAVLGCLPRCGKKPLVSYEELLRTPGERVAQNLAQALTIGCASAREVRVGRPVADRLSESDVVILQEERRSYYRLFHFEAQDQRGLEVRLQCDRDCETIVYPRIYLLDSHGASLDVALGSIEGKGDYHIDSVWRGTLAEDGEYYIIVTSDPWQIGAVLATSLRFSGFSDPIRGGWIDTSKYVSITGSPVGSFKLTVELFPEAVGIDGLADGDAVVSELKYARLERATQVDSTLAGAVKGGAAQRILWRRPTRCRLSTEDRVLVHDERRSYCRVYTFKGKPGPCELAIESHVTTNVKVDRVVIPEAHLVDAQGVELVPDSVWRRGGDKLRYLWRWRLPDVANYHLVVTSVNDRQARREKYHAGSIDSANRLEAIPTGEMSLVLRDVAQ